MEEEEEKRKWRSIIEEDEEEEGEKQSEEVIIRSTVTFDLLVQAQLDINLQDVQFGNDSFFTVNIIHSQRLSQEAVFIWGRSQDHMATSASRYS